ncbi:MAG: hypothetical protein LBT83_03850 [Tannerella sp.]|nr:hypothetical protein [Tannerella sp.]
MKSIIYRMICVSIFVCFFTSFAMASENKNSVNQKEQKPKKVFNWLDMRPKKLSGNVDMDAYILYCDTIWDRIQNYKESIAFFKLDTIWSPTEKCKVVKIVDEEGNPKNFSASFQQGVMITLTGTNIILDAANITLLTASAGTAIVGNPLLAISYSKCLAGGPIIVKLAYNEVKEIVDATKVQMTDIKQMKKSQLEGSTDQAIILPMEEGEIPDPDKIALLADIDKGNSDNESDIDFGKLDEIPEVEIKN